MTCTHTHAPDSRARRQGAIAACSADAARCAPGAVARGSAEMRLACAVAHRHGAAAVALLTLGFRVEAATMLVPTLVALLVCALAQLVSADGIDPSTLVGTWSSGAGNVLTGQNPDGVRGSY